MAVLLHRPEQGQGRAGPDVPRSRILIVGETGRPTPRRAGWVKGPTVRPIRGKLVLRPHGPDIRSENITLRSRSEGLMVSPRMLVVAALAALASGRASISSALVPSRRSRRRAPPCPPAWCRCRVRPGRAGTVTVRHTPPGPDPGRLDDRGVGPGAGGPAGRLDPGRGAAGLGAGRGPGAAARPGPGRGTHPAVLLDGLDQPHGLAFAGDTLYVAESDQVDAYAYAAGAATDPRVVADGLPDAKSPELGGAYAHALKSVAVGPDGAVYFSIGSTGNVSAEDRTAQPAAGRDPAGARRAAGRRSRSRPGVRNGTGLAVAPDGSVWTAVNNRDNIGYPYDRPYAGDVRLVLRPGHPGLRRRPPGRGAGPAHRRPGPGLAVLQPGPATCEPGVRRHRATTWPRRRSCATCRPTRTAASWTAPRWPRSSRASARTRRRWG